MEVNTQANEGVLTANEDFYKAFNQKDLAAMHDLWAGSDDISCIHPGWNVLQGCEAEVYMEGVLWPIKFGDSRLAFDRLHTGTFVAGAAALSAAVRTCTTRRTTRRITSPPPPRFSCLDNPTAPSGPFLRTGSLPFASPLARS